MNLYHLAYFTVLAQTEHYGKAAEILGITQPSLSHAMASMEQELGVPLFDKSGRNIVLSRYGHQFLMPVTQALDILNKGLQDLKDVQSGGGVLQIGCTPVLGTSMVPNLICEFGQTEGGAQVQFQLHTGTSIQLLDGLEKGIYDIVFCSQPEHRVGLTLTPFSKERMVLIVPHDHVLAKFDSIHLQRVLEFPFIAFTPEHCYRDIVDSMFLQLDLQPQPYLQIGDEQVIAGMVAKGFGIAVIPHSPLLSALSIKVLQISAPQWIQYTYTAIRQEGYRSPALTALHTFCTRAGRILT